MISRRLSRTLATLAVPPLAYPTPRHHAANVLNVNPGQIAAEVDRDLKRYKMTNYATKIRVNTFLHAVFAHDVPQATSILGKLRRKCSANRNSDGHARNVEVYMSCQATLIHYAAAGTTKPLAPREVLELVAEVLRVPASVANGRKNQVLDLQTVLVAVLLKALRAVPPDKKRTAAILQAQVLEVARVQSIPADAVYGYLSAKMPQLIEQYNVVWKQNMPLVEERPTLLNVDKYLNSDRSMSFDGMCSMFAGEQFDAAEFTDDKSAKLYDIYDHLPHEQKGRFRQQYLQFSERKQLAAEKYCQDLQKSVTPQGNSPSVPVVHQSMGLPLVSQLHGKMCSRLGRILLGKDPDSPVARAVLQHAYLFEHISKETLTSMVLTTLLREATKEGHLAWVSHITKNVSFQFKGLVRRNETLAPLLKLADLFLGTDELVGLISALIKLAVDTKIESDLLKSFTTGENIVGDYLFALAYEKAGESTPSYKRAGVIRAHPFLLRQTAFLEELLQNGMQLFPMVVPPRPWTSPSSGGFLGNLAPLVRSLDPQLTSKYLAQAHLAGQLGSTFQSLNALGSVPWAVNCDMMSTMDEIMAVPNGYLNIPPTFGELGKSKPPELPKRDHFDDDSSYRLAQQRYLVEVRKHTQTLANLRSQRSFYDMNVQLAKSFDAKGDMIYYPQTLDFRGRVYPAVSILSYQGEDFVRSLLVFWEGKPLGSHGFNWLKYQLANLYCKNFMSMEALLEFVDVNRASIVDSATNPLSGSLWWTHADSPWQSLALCKEINKVWNYDGPKQDYLCRIPIHMDGTCNGLQHYAALGANVSAARSVNLLPTKEKNDIYITVLSLVEKSIEKDCHSENLDTRLLAQEASRCVSRKVVKQTVMTTVYGVTLYGAYRQIREKLAASPDEIASSRLAVILLYLARQVLAAVGDLFGEAKAIQNFLTQNTIRCISAFDRRFVEASADIDFFGTAARKPMMWTSLSGFPVIQTYRKKEAKELRTVLQNITARRLTSTSPIDTRKQLNGVAPNFIHSLDALHLLMTNLAANSKGIAFAAIHDSFWTHACDVEDLSKIIRQEFVRLHSSDVLLNFYRDLEHTNRSAYQLVWVENKHNEQMVADLQKLRLEYLGGPKNRKDILNQCLRREFTDNDRVKQLVDKHHPILILQTKSDGEGIIYDSESETQAAKTRVSFATHTPLLVDIRLSPVPKVGDLDITAVLDSKFFFS